MRDYLVSLFLDDELTLNEKQDFIDAVAFDAEFRQTAHELLAQENTLCDAINRISPPEPFIPFRSRLMFGLTRFIPVLAGGTAAALLLAALLNVQLSQSPPDPVIREVAHRFVLYLPEAHDAAVVGSFSHWSPVPMQKIGKTGYWALDMQLAPGEYRYSYLLESSDRIADPTIQARERDDFGGENSIITVGVKI